MDARLDLHDLLGLDEGDAHVIRNAGGAITEDAIRSLVISQRLLGTREILLIHHTDCGMLTFTDEALKGTSRRKRAFARRSPSSRSAISMRTFDSRSPGSGRTRSSRTATTCEASSTTSAPDVFAR